MWTIALVFAAGVFAGVVIGMFTFALINAGRRSVRITPPGPERLWRATR